jgi:hypothetical protein
MQKSIVKVLSSSIDDSVTAGYDVVVVSMAMLRRSSVTTLRTDTDSVGVYVT